MPIQRAAVTVCMHMEMADGFPQLSVHRQEPHFCGASAMATDDSRPSVQDCIPAGLVIFKDVRCVNRRLM